MTGNKALVVAAITALGVLGAASAAASDHNGNQDRPRAYVLPCSLDGLNPVYHPEIFGNPAVAAREYGFVQSRDGVWHVQCSGAGAPAAAGNYASTTQKAPGHHRKTVKP
jgi:hypothetical protein